MPESSSTNLEALVEHTSNLQISLEANFLRALVNSISRSQIKKIIDSASWARKGGVNSPNDFARRQIASGAASNLKRQRYLAKVWIVDHVDLVEHVQDTLSPDAVRERVPDLFENTDASPEEIAFALRFDPRAEVRDVATDGLFEELFAPTSAIRIHHTLQEQREENERLQADLEELKAEKEKEKSKASDLQSKLKDAKREVRQKTNEVGRLKNQLDDRSNTIDDLRDKISTLKSELRDVKEARDDANDTLENVYSEVKATKQRLKESQEAQEDLLTSVKAGLDREADLKPEDVETAIRGALFKYQKEVELLQDELDRTRAERNQIAPALDRIDEAWGEAVRSFASSVSSALTSLDDTEEEIDPHADWDAWLSEERSKITPILDSVETPSQEHAEHVRRLQRLLELRWYLLEWILNGIRRHLNDSSVVTQTLND